MCESYAGSKIPKEQTKQWVFNNKKTNAIHEYPGQQQGLKDIGI